MSQRVTSPCFRRRSGLSRRPPSLFLPSSFFFLSSFSRPLRILTLIRCLHPPPVFALKFEGSVFLTNFGCPLCFSGWLRPSTLRFLSCGLSSGVADVKRIIRPQLLLLMDDPAPSPPRKSARSMTFSLRYARVPCHGGLSLTLSIPQRQ